MNLILGILFIGGGYYLRFQMNKRQFNRRNMAGVEEFKSYGNSVTTRMTEKVGRYVGFFLLLFGIFLAISYFVRPSNGAHDTNKKVNRKYRVQ